MSGPRGSTYGPIPGEMQVWALTVLGSGVVPDRDIEALLGGHGVRVIELVEASAATALEHASELHGHLREAAAETDALRDCRAEMHRLVGDIVSLRNAAELLRREAMGEVIGRAEPA